MSAVGTRQTSKHANCHIRLGLFDKISFCPSLCTVAFPSKRLSRLQSGRDLLDLTRPKSKHRTPFSVSEQEVLFLVLECAASLSLLSSFSLLSDALSPLSLSLFQTA
eukprot:2831018-Rhodomonas_salina.3